MPKPLRRHRKSGVVTPKGTHKPVTDHLEELLRAFLTDGNHFHFPGDGRVFLNGNQLPNRLKERCDDALEQHLREYVVFQRGGKKSGQGNK